MPIGTCDCPQLIEQYLTEDSVFCSLPSDVYDVGPDASSNNAYKSVCADGHVHYFGQEYYDEKVTPNP